MTEIKKKFKLDEEGFTKKVFDYLKSNINVNKYFEDILYRCLDNYYSLNNENIMIAKKFLINLANQDNLIRFYNKDNTKDILTAHHKDVEFYYYKQHFEISIEGSLIHFNHPERGRATYNMNDNTIFINGVSKLSLQGYFKNYSLGKTGEWRYDNFSDRIIMVHDLRESGNPFLCFVAERIVPNLKSLIDHHYKNLGILLPYFKTFENTFNWYEIGFKLNYISPIKPSQLPNEYRTILLDKNIELKSDIFRQASQDIEYFKRLVVLLNEEQIPNDRLGNSIYSNSHWESLLSSTKLCALVKNYNYDLKATLRYMFNYIIPYENLTVNECLEKLRDYASMHHQMGIQKFKRHPKYLKSMHDIIKGEFENFKTNYNEILFKKNIKQELSFESKIFVVELPEKTDDIKYEGKILSHCVGSYIKRIIEGKTQIIFLRKEKGIPLVTLEVRDNVLIQAKGEANRGITKEEKKYIDCYAKEKKLLVRV